MAIEIRELVIKMNVEERNRNSSSPDSLELARFRKSILKECKREIRDQLNKKKGR